MDGMAPTDITCWYNMDPTLKYATEYEYTMRYLALLPGTLTHIKLSMPAKFP